MKISIQSLKHVEEVVYRFLVTIGQAIACKDPDGIYHWTSHLRVSVSKDATFRTSGLNNTTIGFHIQPCRSDGNVIYGGECTVIDLFSEVIANSHDDFPNNEDDALALIGGRIFSSVAGLVQFHEDFGPKDEALDDPELDRLNRDQGECQKCYEHGYNCEGIDCDYRE